MTRNLKTLGLALVAAMAMTAVMASAAQAQFTADEAPVTLTADATEHVFTTAEGEVTCEDISFHGEAANTAQPDLTITPIYTDCEAFGLAAEITGFGHHGEPEATQCDYLFHADGTVDLDCGPEGHIVIDTSASCDVTIPPQDGLSSVSYDNIGEGSTRETVVDADVSGITYVNTGHGFLCTIAGITHYGETTHSGTYTGKSNVTGEDPDTGAHIGVEAHEE
jgi:hypothetical protein